MPESRSRGRLCRILILATDDRSLGVEHNGFPSPLLLTTLARVSAARATVAVLGDWYTDVNDANCASEMGSRVEYPSAQESLQLAGTTLEGHQGGFEEMKARITIGVLSALALVGIVELCNALESVVGY